MSGVNKHSCAIESGKFDLDRILGCNDNVFALFYATWCPYSMAFLPHFQKHAEARGHKCVRITIDDKASLFDRYKVEYMPTIIYFKNGRPEKRLDSAPHVGLSEKQLLELIASCAPSGTPR
jgi:thioredoxin-like negative regulator of GroEL